MLLEYAEDDSNLPEGILLRRRPVARGETLFRTGDPFHSVFAVKSGSFKTLLPSQSGQDQIIGFHFPGETMGTAGVAEGIYPCTARALEVSTICEVRMERLEESGQSAEMLQRAIIEMLGKEVSFNNTLMTSLIRQSAEQRIGAFLLNLSQRLQVRGQTGEEFSLSMSRSDMGSYLGLASETVSRVLTRFQKAELIELDKKRVHLLSPERLADVVDEV
ncbi:helix-turn-helix domain-containing protein [Pseudomonadota bacterium]